MAAEGEHPVGSGLDGCAARRNGDMRRADQERLGAELVCQPHTEPLAARADPHDFADRLIGEARGAPEGGDRLLRAGAPGADPMRFAAVTELIPCEDRTGYRAGKCDRKCRKAGADDAPTIESEA